MWTFDIQDGLVKELSDSTHCVIAEVLFLHHAWYFVHSHRDIDTGIRERCPLEPWIVGLLTRFENGEIVAPNYSMI